MRGWLAVVLLSAIGVAQADERAETRRLAPKYAADSEVSLPDGTICDLVSKTEAIEIDYAPKWAEAVGQSLHYAEMTGKSPAIIILLKDPQTEWRHLVRCARLCGKLGIKLYVEELTAPDPREDQIAQAKPSNEAVPIGYQGIKHESLPEQQPMTRSWPVQPKAEPKPQPKTQPKPQPKPQPKAQPIVQQRIQSAPIRYYSPGYSSPGYCPPGLGSS